MTEMRVGERIMAEKHYGPRLRGMFETHCAGQGDGSTVDAGVQVNYIQNRLKFRPVVPDQLASVMSRYANRCGVPAAMSMRRYFNPKGIILSRLPQETRDLWFHTVSSELTSRGLF